MDCVIKSEIEFEIQEIATVSAILCFPAIFFYICSYYNLGWAVQGATLLIIFLLIVSPFKGYCAFLISAILNDDAPLSGPDSSVFSSLYFTKFGPLTCSTTLLVMVVVVAFMHYVVNNKREFYRVSEIDKYMFIYATCLVPAFLMLFNNLNSGFSRIIEDIYPIVYFLLFYIATRLFVINNSEYIQLIRIFVSAIIAKVFIIFVLTVLEIGVTWSEDLLRVTFESGIRLYPAAVFWPLVVLFAKKQKTSLVHTLYLVIVAFVGIFAIFSLVTRLLILTTLLGLFLMPKAAINRKGKIVFVALGITGMVMVVALKPDMARSMQDRVLQIFVSPISADTGEFKALSQVVRIIEGINVVYKLLDDKTILIGAGPGSWFDDRYYNFPFASIIGKWDYDEQTLATGKIPRPHFPWVTIFFKAGLLGVFAHIMIFTVVFKKLKLLFTHNSMQLNSYLYTFYALLISVVVSFYSNKVYGVLGLLIAFVAHDVVTKRDVKTV